jgi:pimeloyl-ACP methyl ester carboxylesterase
MSNFISRSLGVLALTASLSVAFAAPALSVLGRDFSFPNRIDGLPTRLSDFSDLEINSFKTNDGVKLAYWEAGSGKPLVIIPGWSASGAEFVNVIYLLSKNYHVYVLDPRNQGLSDRVDCGMRISRYAMDVKEFGVHLGLKSADYLGWSMGASVLWNYIDLFGSRNMRKVVFVDEPISIYSHADWSEQQRLDAGGMTTSPERMIAAFTSAVPVNQLIADTRLFERYVAMDSPYYENSQKFVAEFIKNDPKYLALIMFDHVMNDWRDVITSKIDRPVAIFTGEYSANVPSQRWMQSVIPDATLYVYRQDEQGDHFLMFKNPFKFTRDLGAFLER